LAQQEANHSVDRNQLAAEVESQQTLELTAELEKQRLAAKASAALAAHVKKERQSLKWELQLETESRAAEASAAARATEALNVVKHVRAKHETLMEEARGAEFGQRELQRVHAELRDGHEELHRELAQKDLEFRSQRTEVAIETAQLQEEHCEAERLSAEVQHETSRLQALHRELEQRDFEFRSQQQEVSQMFSSLGEADAACARHQRAETALELHHAARSREAQQEVEHHRARLQTSEEAHQKAHQNLKKDHDDEKDTVDTALDIMTARLKERQSGADRRARMLAERREAELAHRRELMGQHKSDLNLEHIARMNGLEEKQEQLANERMEFKQEVAAEVLANTARVQEEYWEVMRKMQEDFDLALAEVQEQRSRDPSGSPGHNSRPLKEQFHPHSSHETLRARCDLARGLGELQLRLGCDMTTLSPSRSRTSLAVGMMPTGSSGTGVHQPKPLPHHEPTHAHPAEPPAITPRPSPPRSPPRPVSMPPTTPETAPAPPPQASEPSRDQGSSFASSWLPSLSGSWKRLF